ncbi:MAG TPA: hypothetical protein VMW72_16495 [Sedimentisphaerales bacterium]|nr:hypothetical protein [Sedimentisphaerales bacterium]
MKEMIIVAGENTFNVAWLKHCLKERHYSSILCETVEEIIEELETLPTCGVYVPLVLIESEILKNISDELINRLRECKPEVPFILLDEENLPETNELICANRAKFEWDGNPLTKVLEGAGVESTCATASSNQGRERDK